MNIQANTYAQTNAWNERHRTWKTTWITLILEHKRMLLSLVAPKGAGGYIDPIYSFIYSSYIPPCIPYICYTNSLYIFLMTFLIGTLFHQLVERS